jgi:hypothetical protein
MPFYSESFTANGTIIQIRRSQVRDEPKYLANGELAYSFTSDKLWIGKTETAQSEPIPIEIGGRYLVEKVNNLEANLSTIAGNTSFSISDVLDQLQGKLSALSSGTYVDRVDFSATPTEGGVGTTVTLSVVPVGDPNQYKVNWGDGTVATFDVDDTPTHTYTNNANSPFDVTVTALNTDGSGDASQASNTKVDMITINTADPEVRFSLFSNTTTNALLLEANTGEPVYLRNDTTNVGEAEATFHVAWGDGAQASIANTTTEGGTSGGRISHTYSRAGDQTITLSINSHSTATASIFPLSDTQTIRVFNLDIAAPDDITTKTISVATSTVGNLPKLAHGFDDNVSSGKTAGDAVSSSFPRIVSGTITSDPMTSYFHTEGAVTQLPSGDPILDESNVDYYNLDSDGTAISASERIYARGLYQTATKARISFDVTTVDAGVNKISLVTDEGNSNEILFLYDDMVDAPVIDITEASVAVTTPSLKYISGIPYYDTGTKFTISDVQVSNITGQTYYDGNPFTVAGDVAATKEFSYEDALYAVDRNGAIPAANINGAVLKNLVAEIRPNTKATGIIRFLATNVNGQDSAAFSTQYRIFTANPAFDEMNIPVSDSLGSTFNTDGKRISELVAEEAFDSSVDYYTTNAWTSSSSLDDQAIVFNDTLQHFTQDLSGTLPAGPDLSVGRDGAQYFTFAFKRTAVSNFAVRLSGKCSGFFIAVPGSSIDQTSGINGWLDASKQFAGSGVPGSNLQNGGNGSDGCAFAGSDKILSGTTYNNQTFNLTLGTESSTNAQDSQVIISIKLNSGDSITALSIEET